MFVLSPYIPPKKIPLLWLFLNAIPWPRDIFCPRCSKVSIHGSREILSSKARRLASHSSAKSSLQIPCIWKLLGAPSQLIRWLGLYPVLKASLHHFLDHISSKFWKNHLPGIGIRFGCQLDFINGNKNGEHRCNLHLINTVSQILTQVGWKRGTKVHHPAERWKH